MRLTEAQYAKAFDLLKRISSEHSEMLRWAERYAPSATGRNTVLRVLSVGSGTGDFDLAFVELLQRRFSCPVKCTLIEPNSEHVAELRRTVEKRAGDGIELSVFAGAFESFHSEESFDTILFSHSLYYFPNKEEVLRKALPLLGPDGEIVIFNNTPLGIPQLQRKFASRVEDTEVFFTTDSVVDWAERSGVTCRHDLIESYLDVSTCLEGDGEDGTTLLSFFFNTDLVAAPGTVLSEATAFLRDLSFARKGRRLLFHPVGVVLLKAASGHG